MHTVTTTNGDATFTPVDARVHRRLYKQVVLYPSVSMFTGTKSLQLSDFSLNSILHIILPNIRRVYREYVNYICCPPSKPFHLFLRSSIRGPGYITGVSQGPRNRLTRRAYLSSHLRKGIICAVVGVTVLARRAEHVSIWLDLNIQ